MAREIKKIIKEPAVKRVVKKENKKVVVTDEMIAQKAFLLYEKRGYQAGFELEDWLEAKRILEAGE